MFEGFDGDIAFRAFDERLLKYGDAGSIFFNRRSTGIQWSTVVYDVSTSEHFISKTLFFSTTLSRSKILSSLW